MERIQIAVSTDAKMFRPSMVTVMSALEGTPRPVTVHVLGMDLDDGHGAALERLERRFPGTRTCLHELPARLHDDWKKAATKRHSPAMLASLLVPTLLEGRVLYLDSDTLVCSDVGALFDLDIDGCHVAAVRDYERMLMLVESLTGSERYRRDQRKPHAAIMAPHPASDFFNSGVVLFNCDSIAAEPGLADRLADTGEIKIDDSERLNRYLKGRVLHLGMSWNAIAGLYGRYPMLHGALVEGEDFHDPPRIAHYYGVVKPWHSFSADEMSRDFERARRKLFKKTNLARTEDFLWNFVKDKACAAEYARMVGIWRRASLRLTAILDG